MRDKEKTAESNLLHNMLELPERQQIKITAGEYNRPFPSSLVPLFQSEFKYETIVMKMTLICMKTKLHAELIFI